MPGAQDTATETLTVHVVGPPSIISTSAATFQTGTSSSFTVTSSGYGANPNLNIAPTNGYPIAHLSETGPMPVGLRFVDNGNGTATLAGTPTGPAAPTRSR